MEALISSGDFWAILIKTLITAVITGVVGLIGTLIGKLLIKLKDSKITKHVKIAVEAAEQKFPNEGSKMGPQKMAYVMDYLAITFPKIKNNQYLYNIAEAAVYELNREKEEAAAKKEFKEKYGELPVIEGISSQEDIIDNIPETTSISSLSTTTVKTEKKIMNIF